MSLLDTSLLGDNMRTLKEKATSFKLWMALLVFAVGTGLALLDKLTPIWAGFSLALFVVWSLFNSIDKRYIALLNKEDIDSKLNKLLEKL